MGATLNSLFVGSSGEAGRVVLMSRLTGIPSASVLATVVLERAVDLVRLSHAARVRGAALSRFLAQRIVGACVASGLVAVIALAHQRVAHPPRDAASHELHAHRDRSSPRVPALRAARVRLDARHRDAAACLDRDRAHAPGLVLRAGCRTRSSRARPHFPMGVRGSLLALLAVNVGFLVRVTPGNVGVFELVYATVAHSLGLSYELAIGVALMLHLVQDVPTALLGLSLGARFFSREALPSARTRSALAQPQVVANAPSSAVPHTEPARGTCS